MHWLLIREMVEDDLYRGFLDVLDELSLAELTLEEASVVFAKRMMNPSSKTFVAIDTSFRDTPIIGTASLLVEQKYIHSGGKVAFVEDVVVDSDYRKSGVGKALIEHLYEVARKAGCYKLVLDCDEEVAPFYERSGFYRNGHAMRLDIPPTA
jgi:glucosamine-phosphate N-acetyltransferase